MLSITVDTLVDENDGISTGGVSLRDAIAAATSGETIDFNPALFSGGPGTILLDHGEMSLEKELTILGPGDHLLTIDAQQNSRIFHVGLQTGDTLDNVEIIGMTLTGGWIDVGNGGAIFSYRTNLEITDCTIADNVAGTNGGGISAFAASLTVVNSTIAGNKSNLLFHGFGGGGIFADSATTTLVDSVIDGNSSFDGEGGSGGGIYKDLGALIVERSTISNNRTRFSGGGVGGFGGTIQIIDSSISGNQAEGGGGIAGSSGPVNLSNSTISGNLADRGGGVYLVVSSLSAEGSTISGNSAVFEGGASTEVGAPASYSQTARSATIRQVTAAVALLNWAVAMSASSTAPSAGIGLLAEAALP